MPVCDRCLEETRITTMSYFNTQTICMGCKEKEREHPDFNKAFEAECQQVKNGNYNFEGIGLPDDLK